MAEAAIEVHDLVKRYGDRTAVAGIDLHVAEGEIVAFLGPNGAGKTTAIEILEGYRTPTSGHVRVLGADPATAPRQWRERIGIVLQESEPTPELTAAESVRMQSHYYTAPRDPGEILELVGLTDSAHQRVRKLSGGQKRRLDLAMALVGDPELIFLDEPTTGFDPGARRESWGMIEALRDLGRTVLLTTHYMDEAERLADRITVINAGEIVATGTSAELTRRVRTGARITWRQPPDRPAPPDRFGWARHEEQAVIETDDVVGVLNQLTSWSIQHDVPLDQLSVTHPSLEDVFLILTSDPGSLRDPQEEGAT
jgi:ABC-2 type transport system ATP-binding protein